MRAVRVLRAAGLLRSLAPPALRRSGGARRLPRQATARPVSGVRLADGPHPHSRGILFQCLCILAQDHPKDDDEFFALYGIRLVASITRELAGIHITNFFLLHRWIQLITTPTHGKLPLHTIQIDKIRERLTKSQAERAEEKERDSNALATTEDYLQAFGFVKALLSVCIITSTWTGILAC